MLEEVASPVSACQRGNLKYQAQTSLRLVIVKDLSLLRCQANYHWYASCYPRIVDETLAYRGVGSRRLLSQLGPPPNRSPFEWKTQPLSFCGPRLGYIATLSNLIRIGLFFPPFFCCTICLGCALFRPFHGRGYISMTWESRELLRSLFISGYSKYE